MNLRIWRGLGASKSSTAMYVILSPSDGAGAGGVSGERLTKWEMPSAAKALIWPSVVGADVPASFFSSTHEKFHGSCIPRRRSIFRF